MKTLGSVLLLTKNRVSHGGLCSEKTQLRALAEASLFTLLPESTPIPSSRVKKQQQAVNLVGFS